VALATIRILPLGGYWETFGADRLRGISAEGITAACDSWGPSSLDFQVKAEAGARRPDLLPYTPVELEVDGILCWAGFVFTRPSDDNNYSVGCRGWQYHLDDDLFDRSYVHTRLSDWQDVRSLLSYNLATYTTSWGVEAGTGGIALTSAPVALNGSSAAVLFDAGPDSTIKRVVIAWTSSNNDANNTTAYFDSGGSLPLSVGANVIAGIGTGGASGTYALTLSTAQRYVQITLGSNVHTPPAEVWFKVSSALLFRDTAYESGNASILKSDQVIRDALSFATLLSQDPTYISAGTFSIPSYETSGYITPRQAMEAVNVVENMRLKIGGPDLKHLVYDAKPSAPIIEVGDWAGSQFSDATVTGEPIYSRAILDGTGPDGLRLVSKRTQSGTLVDRRGFQRSSRVDVGSAVTQAIADRINDLWLTEHDTAPFSGTLNITGSGARRIVSGQEVPPHLFLLYAGERVRLSNRVDPDTGAWGRDGRIASATYNHSEGSVSLSLDEQPWRWAEVMARYGMLLAG
jgi:hypothetical protein